VPRFGPKLQYLDSTENKGFGKSPVISKRLSRMPQKLSVSQVAVLFLFETVASEL
jgi:hypothetical protein